MTIIHVINSLDFDNGGPSKSVSDLATYQSSLGKNVVILSLNSPNPFFKEDIHYFNLKIVFLKSIFLKNALASFLNNKEATIFHGHGIWQWLVHNLSVNARIRKIPYVISPRGMLEPWALNAGKWKKKLAMALYQRSDLAKATCIHATAQMEADNIRKLGFTNPIAIIPNGIVLSEYPIREDFKNKSDKTLLFLSRIHPKKGIEILIEAWSLIDKRKRDGWKVEIAGNGEDRYLQSLLKLIQDRGLESVMSIIGPQFGESKLEAYHRADLFVLPTYSENFGIVVAEALACGVPVITTKGAPWEELNTHKAGWWIDIGVHPLAEALEKAMSLQDHERSVMGLNGRKLIEEKYSIEAVATKMIFLYQWILGQGEKPDFVY
jgi:glycosyltransferase involved in cell wall biosynthesis